MDMDVPLVEDSSKLRSWCFDRGALTYGTAVVVKSYIKGDSNDVQILGDPFPVKTVQEDEIRLIRAKDMYQQFAPSLQAGSVSDVNSPINIREQRYSHADVAHTAEHSMEAKAATKTGMEAALGCNFYTGERSNGAWKTIIAGWYTAIRSIFLRRTTDDRFANGGNTRDRQWVVQISPRWLLDSGASYHSTGDRTIFRSLHSCEPKYVKTASGAICKLEECGRVEGAVNLSGVMHFPGSPENLVSAGLLAKKGCDINLTRGRCTILKDGRLIGRGHQVPEDVGVHRGLYILDEFDDSLLEPVCPMCPNAHALDS